MRQKLLQNELPCAKIKECKLGLILMNKKSGLAEQILLLSLQLIFFKDKLVHTTKLCKDFVHGVATVCRLGPGSVNCN